MNARANAQGGSGGFGGGQGVPGTQSAPTSGGNYPGDGGNGGNATASATGTSVTTDSPALAAVNVTAQAIGGTGNSGADANSSSGNGGTATATAYGSSNVAATVDVSVQAVGGNGGGGNNFENGTFGEGPANGGSGAAVILNNAVNGETNGGTLEFNETAEGGSGGSSDGGTVGAAGEGSASLVFNDTKSGTESALVNATATGVGGSGGTGSGGSAGANGGAGISDVSITGAKAVDATAYATGGSGGTGIFDGVGGSATATAVGVGGTAVQSVADAVGGQGQGTSAAGTALAMSSAQGASGSARSLASTTDTGKVAITSASASATATVTGAGSSGAVAATAGVGFGDIAQAVPTGQQAVAIIDAMPSAAIVSSALATNGAVAFEFGNGATAFALGQLAASANGTAVTQTETATITMQATTALIAASGQVVLGLYGGAPTGGFTSMTFSVTANGTPLINETFTSAAAADAFFDDNVLDLGSDTTGPLAGSPTLTVSLSVTEDTAGGGYSLGIAGEGVSVAGSSIAPIIVGTVSGQTTTSATPVTPFSTVIVEDPNVGASDTLAITYTGADGTLAGTGLTGSAGDYSLTGSAALITSELRALTFTPSTTGTTTFTLSDTSSAFLTPTVNSLTTVTDTNIAVAPTISGTVPDQTTTSEKPDQPFSGVTITDPNDGGADDDTLTITFAGSNGTLAGTGLTGSNGSDTLTGTAAAITTALQALTFTPIDGVANTSVTTKFTLSDLSSAFGTPAVDSTTTVTDSDPAEAPTIQGTQGGQTTTLEKPDQPFSGVTITDPNNNGVDSDTLTISFAAGGTLTGSGLGGGSGNYTLTGTAAAITSELRAVSFTPANGVPNTSVTTTFSLSDLSSAYATPTVDVTTSVIDSDPAVAPTISGAVGGQTTMSEAAITPFAGVTLADTNDGGGDTDTLTITLSGSGGALAGIGLTGTGPVYTLSGTAAAITTELRALTFTPGTSGTTTFTLSDLSSAFATPTVNKATTVTDSDTTVIPPSISGTSSGQTTVDYVPLKPFSTVTVTNAVAGMDSLAIVLTNSSDVATDANGLLSGTSLTKTGVGTYTLAAAAPGTLTAELQALTFTPTLAEVPTGKTVTTGFSLTASEVEGATTATTTNSATSIIVTALNYVNGPAGGFGVLVGTPGQDVITAHGLLNVIYGQGGADFINAGSGLAYVDVANGSATVTLGGVLNDVTGTNGNVTVTGAPGGLTTVTLGNGNDVVTIGGKGDTIRLGNGTNMVSGTQGMAFIATGSGNDTITLGGSGNTVNAGGGTNVIHGGTGSDTFMLPPASIGFDTITGFSETNGDLLNLAGALAATHWNGRSATLGNYLKVTDNNGSTTLSIAANGTGGGIAIANLNGAGNLGLADLLSHHSLLT